MRKESYNKFQFSPEYLFLTKFSAYTLTEKLKVECEELLSEKLDWDLIIELANYHAVSPVIYRNLKYLDAIALLAPEHSKALRKEYHANFIKNTTLIEQFGILKKEIFSAGLKFLPIKGILFLYLFPEHTALRQMSDIDILINPDDARQFIDIISAHGYVPKGDTNLFKKFGNEISLTKEVNKIFIHIELQCRVKALNEKLWFDFGSVMQGSSFDAELALYLPSPADSFMMNFIHIQKHIYQGKEIFKWIASDAEFLRRYLSSSEIETLSERLGLSYRKKFLRYCRQLDAWFDLGKFEHPDELEVLSPAFDFSKKEEKNFLKLAIGTFAYTRGLKEKILFAFSRLSPGTGKDTNGDESGIRSRLKRIMYLIKKLFIR
ncbi:MAG: nucleotidyltransferase family protein [Candidatus Schekmanbacteria bacterium]|nr:nucleotidyltransferase family protein [Candidatus Schekmanbacteria bacterium]